MKNNITAVIISYNDYDSLYKCINSAYEYVQKIIVVDNSHDYINTFTCYQKDIVYIDNKCNLGLSKALNIGIKEAMKTNIDWILLLDQDSILDKNMITKMLSSYDNSKDKDEIAQIVPIVYDNNQNKELPSLIYHKFNLEKIFKTDTDRYIDFQITSGSLLKKSTIKSLGFMHKDFFIDYIDFDYCFRIRKAGYRILLSHNALLYHALGERKNKYGISFVEHSSFRIFYQVRNRIILMKKYGSFFPFFVFTESRNLIMKLMKIILLENNKLSKIKNYFKGFYCAFKRE